MPRRPWLDADALKSAFHRLGAAAHPDTSGGDAGRFAEVNSAWQTLRDPAQRLRHLLELEGAPPSGHSTPIPPALADLFMHIAGLRRELDAFSQREAAASGALAKALLAADRAALTTKLKDAAAKIETHLQDALTEVRAIDSEWKSHATTTLARLGELQQALAFLGKWQDQLREALYALPGNH